MAIIQTPSIASVVEDQTPQLGGDLDCQDYQITDVGLLQWGDATLPYQASVLFGNTLYFRPTVDTSAKYLFRGAGANKNLQHSILSTEIITYIGSDQSLHTYRGQNASLRYRWRAGSGSNVNAELGTDYLELRDGANPFTQTIFNTYTDASNNEALSIGWSGNEAVITTTAAGTGVARGMKLQNTGGNFTIDASSSVNIIAGGGITLYAEGTIYQQLTIDGVGYRKDCYPIFDSSLDLGTTSLRWANTYTDNLIATDNISNGDGSRFFPAYTFASQTGMGVYRHTVNQLGLVAGSLKGAVVGPSYMDIGLNSYFSWRNADSIGSGTSSETRLRREEKGILGVTTYDDTPTGIKFFNTLTDASNNEALSIGWDTNEAQIKTTAAGTGTQRILNIGTPNISMLFVDGSSIQVDEDFYCTGATNNTLNLGTQSRRWGNTYSRTVLADAVRNTSIQTHTATGSVNIYETMNLVDATSGAVTLTLPAASGTGLQMTFKKIDASANTVTIDGNGSETIDGALTQVISTQYNSITVVSDGSNWFII